MPFIHNFDIVGAIGNLYNTYKVSEPLFGGENP